MLTFDRQCEQAIELYKEAFRAENPVLMRYSDANPKDLPSKYNSDEDSSLIFHAQIMIGNQRILLCDNLFNDLHKGHTIYLVAMFKNDDEVKAAYSVMVEGATIITPLSSATYTSCSASLIDKFGIHWDLMVFQ